MSGADRVVQLLGKSVAASRRGRFVEEWSSDIASARALGLSPTEIVVAAARVAAFLLWLRVRPVLLRRRHRSELVTIGTALGLVVAVADVQVDVLVPFVVLVLGWRGWRGVHDWVRGAA